MDFRSLTVKELFDNEKTAAVIKEYAPQLLKYPVKLFNKKSSRRSKRRSTPLSSKQKTASGRGLPPLPDLV